MTSEDEYARIKEDKKINGKKRFCSIRKSWIRIVVRNADERSWIGNLTASGVALAVIDRDGGSGITSLRSLVGLSSQSSRVFT